MRAPNRDANEREIVNALRAAGCLVQQLQQGGGVPDLLVLTPASVLVLVEVKDGTKPPAHRRLTPDQVDWHGFWREHGAPVFVVNDVAEALLVVGVRS